MAGKKIKFTVKNESQLVLEEDASIGDIIDLKEAYSIDQSYILNAINDERDRRYKAELQAQVEKLREDYQRETRLKLEAQEKSIRMELSEREQKLNEQIIDKENKLKSTIENFDNEKKVVLSEARVDSERALNELRRQYEEKLRLANEEKVKITNDLNTSLATKQLEIDKVSTEIKSSLNSDIDKLKMELENEKKDKENALDKQKYEMEKEFTEKYKKLQDDYNALQFTKTNKNVKMTGEDLELWCDSEMLSYMQNGFSNCTWEKDNTVVREEGESKGSKGDFVFKIYASNKHNDKELLSSICLEMKNENLLSTNKQTNEHYFKALDKNREKKQCEYALLVSNLEQDNVNLPPIYKVNEYTNMYVVRPEYMITFLNMMVSLNEKAKELILTKGEERLQLINSIELKDKFESLKKTYLDNPLETLKNRVEDIRKQAESIEKAKRKIDEACDAIVSSYINIIQDKLDKFKVDSLAKKLDKLEN